MGARIGDFRRAPSLSRSQLIPLSSLYYRFTDTPPRITPRVASQPSTTGTPSLAPLRRSITTATFGQPTLGIPRSSSAASSSDNEAHARSYEAHDSFGQDFTPPKAGAGRGVGAPMWEANRLTATSFGTLGQ